MEGIIDYYETGEPTPVLRRVAKVCVLCDVLKNREIFGFKSSKSSVSINSLQAILSKIAFLLLTK